jgi:ABC-type dipeptide/oligopeptide/nickel transport system ATPase component
MANLIALVGNSGSGKSTSIRTLNPAETFIINVASKPLPFKGWKAKYTVWNKDNPNGNFINTSDVERISKILDYIEAKRPEIKNIILDDSQYLMAFEAMDRAKEKGFEKFTDIAQKFYSILKASISMRDDLNIIVSCHSENIGDGLNPIYKIKTIGKMIDNVITIEGLFTYVLFTHIESDNGTNSYHFITQSDGTTTAKTPLDCFDSILIPNDLQYVINKIEEFNS